MAKTNLNLKATAGDKVDIGHGEYRRQFKRAEQPFAVDEAERALLLKTGLFEVAPAVVAAVPADEDHVEERPARAPKKQ